MDKVISGYPHVPFGELNYCYQHGIMYQADMSTPIKYDNAYFETYVKLENTDIARKLNAGRTTLSQKYCNKILDIGIGSGEFIKESNVMVYGYDINPVGVKWLKQNGLYRDPYQQMPDVDGLTFWDAMEHIPDPGLLLGAIPTGKYAFISLPVFSDLCHVRESKHYKPNEHFYYFTSHGMIRYMADSKFNLVEMSDYETVAGREGILTFVFQKVA